MVIYGSYMFECGVGKDIKKDIVREVVVGKVAKHLCPTLTIRKFRISIEQGRMVTSLNIILHT
jgi:hypothetical protein